MSSASKTDLTSAIRPGSAVLKTSTRSIGASSDSDCGSSSTSGIWQSAHCVKPSRYSPLHFGQYIRVILTWPHQTFAKSLAQNKICNRWAFSDRRFASRFRNKLVILDQKPPGLILPRSRIIYAYPGCRDNLRHRFATVFQIKDFAAEVVAVELPIDRKGLAELSRSTGEILLLLRLSPGPHQFNALNRLYRAD